MKIYTKIGDRGTTRLGDGREVSKSDLAIETYGTLDELNALLGVACCFMEEAADRDMITKVQQRLFAMGSALANPKLLTHLRQGSDAQSDDRLRIDDAHISELEQWIDQRDEALAPLKSFILPGGCRAAAFIHLARTVCRRAERGLVALHETQPLPDNFLRYLNRLSDALFTIARHENQRAGVADIPW